MYALAFPSDILEPNVVYFLVCYYILPVAQILVFLIYVGLCLCDTGSLTLHDWSNISVLKVDAAGSSETLVYPPTSSRYITTQKPNIDNFKLFSQIPLKEG